MGAYSDPYAKDTIGKFLQRKEVWTPLINAVAIVHSIHSKEFRHIQVIKNALEKFIRLNPEYFVIHKELEMTTVNTENNATKGQHPHADILRAIADGKEIEYKYVSLNKNQPWENCNKERIFEILAHKVECDYEFRIKPEVKTGWIVIFSDHSDPMFFANKPEQTALAGLVNIEAIKEITYTPGEGL